MRPLGRSIACAVVLLGSSSTTARAYYEESHITADDVRITVEPSGIARVEHALTWRVVAGQPHAIDLVGTEPSAHPDVMTTLESDDGRSIPGSVIVMPGRGLAPPERREGLRVTVDEPKALRHGHQYQLTVAYSVNLIDAGELARDGSTYRLTWKGVLPGEGYETPRVTFVLPPALEPPTAFVGEGGMRDDGVTSTLRRDPAHDELFLVRPHIGRGEEVVWAAHVAARAFDASGSPALAPAPPPPKHDEPSGPGTTAYAIMAVLGLLFAGAVRWKDRSFEREARASAMSTHGLLPLPPWERAAVAGAALFVGLSLQLVAAPLAGSLAIALAMAAAVLVPRPAVSSAGGARGPGQWLSLSPREAFPELGRRPRWLGTLVRGLTGIVFVVCVVVAGLLAARVHAEASLFVPLDALVLVPLFSTGRSSQLPPEHARRRAAWLARVFYRLARKRALEVTAFARVPTGLAEPDELRVVVVPREPIPGLTGIEVGLAWARGGTHFAAEPEVLVRVREASAASAKVTGLLLGVVPVPGRKPEERVYRLTPLRATPRATAALVLGLARRLVDLRGEAQPEWAREERRAAPPTSMLPSVLADGRASVG